MFGISVSVCCSSTILFQEDDYVQLAAKHYYVQHGSESSVENAQKVVQECMNMNMIENKSMAKLVQMVHSAHTQVCLYVVTHNTTRLKVCGHLCNPPLFVGHFRTIFGCHSWAIFYLRLLLY